VPVNVLHNRFKLRVIKCDTTLSQEMSVLQEMVYHAHCESCIKVSFPFAPYLYSQLTHNAVNLILDIQMHQENY
jgi:hypothetical protein